MSGCCIRFFKLTWIAFLATICFVIAKENKNGKTKEDAGGCCITSMSKADAFD